MTSQSSAPATSASRSRRFSPRRASAWSSRRGRGSHGCTRPPARATSRTCPRRSCGRWSRPGDPGDDRLRRAQGRGRDPRRASHAALDQPRARPLDRARGRGGDRQAPPRPATSWCSSRLRTRERPATRCCRSSRQTGLQVGTDFHVAFSPERVDPGRTDWTTKTTPKIVGGITGRMQGRRLRALRAGNRQGVHSVLDRRPRR